MVFATGMTLATAATAHHAKRNGTTSVGETLSSMVATAEGVIGEMGMGGLTIVFVAAFVFLEILATFMPMYIAYKCNAGKGYYTFGAVLLAFAFSEIYLMQFLFRKFGFLGFGAEKGYCKALD